MSRKELRTLVTSLCTKHGVNAGTYATDKKLGDDVVSAWAARTTASQRGEVHCGQVYRGMKGEDIPTRTGCMQVYVSKGKGQVGTGLSPFVLPFPRGMYAPYCLTLDGTATGSLLPQRPLELVWQSAKRLEDETLNAFMTRRLQIFRKGDVKRRYFAKGSCIKGAMFGGDCLEYVPSRAVYYFAYDQAARTQRVYTFLDDLLASGVSLLLLGPDGFAMGDTLEEAKEAYCSTVHPFGHERVLVSMLRGYSPADLMPTKETSEREIAETQEPDPTEK